MKPYHHPLYSLYLCAAVAVGAFLSRSITSRAGAPATSTPLPLLVRNQVLFDGRNLLIGKYKDFDEHLNVTGAAAQIWNWDHTWYSTKAYNRAIARAQSAWAGLQIIGNVLYP